MGALADVLDHRVVAALAQRICHRGRLMCRRLTFAGERHPQLGEQLRVDLFGQAQVLPDPPGGPQMFVRGR